MYIVYIMLSKYKQSSYDGLYATTLPKFFLQILGFYKLAYINPLQLQINTIIEATTVYDNTLHVIRSYFIKVLLEFNNPIYRQLYTIVCKYDKFTIMAIR